MVLSCFADTETPCRWEKWMIIDGMLPTSTETPDPLEQEDWWCWLLLTSPPTHQNKVHELIMPSLNCYCKASHSSLQGRMHTFVRQEPAVSPFTWQSNKAILFYFIQKSVFMIQFDTGAQRSWIFGYSPAVCGVGSGGKESICKQS